MKIATIIFIFLFTTTVYGQNNDYKVLLDSAKKMFKGAEELNKQEYEKFDYNKIVTILKKVIELNPNNVEARYFLGYTYGRMNSRDGSGIVNMKLELVKKASEQFEKVNKLAPKYNDEIIILDPYSKVGGEWGSMAMNYKHQNKLDSAIWAFKEGKKRGGFRDVILELNRKILNGCSKNAILISSGDNLSITLWYLQMVENYRKDVSVIDVNLLNTTWYPAYLSYNNIVKFDLPKPVLDTLEDIKWTDSTITIDDFSWTVKPTDEGKYILRGDRVFLSLLKQNKFQRDLYFTIGFGEEQRLNLTEYLTNFIVVDKFTRKEQLMQNDKDYVKSITEILKLFKKINLNSIDELEFYDNFRYKLFKRVDYHLENNEKQKANKLMKILDKYGNKDKIPYSHEGLKKYEDYIRPQL